MPDLRDIVLRLGGHIYAGGRRALVPGPGHSPHDRSLSLALYRDRVIWCSFAGDPPELIAPYLGLDVARPATEAERRAAAETRERERRAAQERVRVFCKSVWQSALPFEGSLAETYLREARGLSATPNPTELRFHPTAPRSYDGNIRAPAMVALVRNKAGRAIGLHATFLRRDGSGHLGRVMFGQVAGGAVRLVPLTRDTLAVAEGIETALAYAQLYSLPTWACLSTSGLRAFEPPAQLRLLEIGADNDVNGAGLTAARVLGQRASARCHVRIRKPKPLGTDWNDCLLRESARG